MTKDQITMIEVTCNVFSSNIELLIEMSEDLDIIRDQKLSIYSEKILNGDNSKETFAKFSNQMYHTKWIHNHSMLISCYAYFENYLRSVCHHLEKTYALETNDFNKIYDKENQVKKYFSVLRGHGISKSTNNSNKNWLKLMEYVKVRNSITHHYGELKHSDVPTLSNEYNIFFSNHKTTIRIKDFSFIDDFSNLCLDYIKNITNEIKKRKGEIDVI